METNETHSLAFAGSRSLVAIRRFTMLAGSRVYACVVQSCYHFRCSPGAQAHWELRVAAITSRFSKGAG